MMVAYFEVMVGLDLYHIIAAFEFDCIVAAFGFKKALKIEFKKYKDMTKNIRN